MAIDAEETYAALSEQIEGCVDDDEKKKQNMKVEYEIEKLKVETEYNRKKIEKLETENGNNNDKQIIKLPFISVQRFSGKFAEWPSFWYFFDATVNKK